MFFDKKNEKLTNSHTEEGVICAPFMNQYMRINENQGVTRERILEAAGLTESELNPPNGWVTQTVIERLFVARLEQQPDPVYGIHCSAALEPSMAGMVGFIALSCPSLLDLHYTLRDFGKLVSNIFRTELTHEPGSTYWTIDFLYTDMIVKRHSTEWVLAGSAMLIHRLYANALLEVHISHAPALLNGKPHPIYEETFKCPVKFGQAQSALVINPQYLNKTSPNGDPLVFTALSNQATLLLEQLKPQTNIIDRVKQEISRLLAIGSVSRDELCKQMGMSSRHLHRQLQLYGSSYQIILDEIRIKSVQDLLIQHSNLDTVSAQLGFSSVKSFARWFDTKMGVTPTEYRRKEQLNPL